MRFLNTLLNDIRFQIKYGFYYLYAFFTIVYITALMIIPSPYKNKAASLIILTDPAMLGIFFIGGIWLLEKEEGLHRFWGVSPLRPLEYLLAKSISLAILSTLSAVLIVVTGMEGRVHIVSLSYCVFLGAVIFNLIGLFVASYAHSVNHYIKIVILPAVFLAMPPVLTAFGMAHPLLELFPGTVLWHLLENAIDRTETSDGQMESILFLWLALLLALANKRIDTALQAEGGDGV